MERSNGSAELLPRPTEISVSIRLFIFEDMFYVQKAFYDVSGLNFLAFFLSGIWKFVQLWDQLMYEMAPVVSKDLKVKCSKSHFDLDIC